MNDQPYRTKKGGLIERNKILNFTFDNKFYTGFLGDTLASALIANGVRIVGRSFKYHRPRGITGFGTEETNALVQLRKGNRTEPNISATQIELYDGLEAFSQNRWPNLNFDLSALNNTLSGLFPSGFYYKTFMWPSKLWPIYEKNIRRVAGIGKSPSDHDPDTYAHKFVHCDILIAGGGPTGLMAALSAGSSGARVILCDQNPRCGGMLLGREAQVSGKNCIDWVGDTLETLRTMDNVTILNRTTATAYYDHNLIVLNERVADHKQVPENHEPRHRLLHVRAKEVVLATGSIERPLVFAENDLPGVMLLSAVQSYAYTYGVLAGKYAVVFTNNSSAYSAAADLKLAGIEVQAIIDTRKQPPPQDLESARKAEIGVLSKHVIVAAHGSKAVNSVTVMEITENGEPVGKPREILCDVVAVSGGWTPSVHLFSQSGGKLQYDEELTAFTPHKSVQREQSAGACTGSFSLRDCLIEGAAVGKQAANNAGFEVKYLRLPTCDIDEELSLQPFWKISPPDHLHNGKRFVDFQNDVTAEDIGLAFREGYRSIEHLKRYTTLGMGTDQGKTSNINGLAIMAGYRAENVATLGTTTFRPPFTPIPLGAVGGLNSHANLTPVRTTPLYHWHKTKGAPFANAGQWLRAQAYPNFGEDLETAVQREAKHVRNHVGIVDISTLGKIDIQGRDSLEFLERIYVNNLSNLAVGKCRYGLMLREDGLVDDDGTVTRISENRYMISTTTLHAGAVISRLEYLSQVEWPDLDIHLLLVTDDWAGIGIAGPQSRRVLERLTNTDISNTVLPFMAYAEVTISDIVCRLFRISFSGELAFEINMAPSHMCTIWEALLKIGADLDIIPYGSETMNILRIEKGHVVGGELNGRVTVADLGFDKMVSTKKHYIGQVLAQREGLISKDRPQLIGLIPIDGRTRIPRGAQLVDDIKAKKPVSIVGEVTSQCMSPNLGHPIGLGLLRGGRKRHGEIVQAHSPLTQKTVAVKVTNPIFIDPDGKRLRV